jgi:hypothetical protein
MVLPILPIAGDFVNFMVEKSGRWLRSIQQEIKRGRLMGLTIYFSAIRCAHKIAYPVANERCRFFEFFDYLAFYSVHAKMKRSLENYKPD